MDTSINIININTNSYTPPIPCPKKKKTPYPTLKHSVNQLHL